MNLRQYAEKILYSEKLEDKLKADKVSLDFCEFSKSSKQIECPKREKRIQFSDERKKFPKVGNLDKDQEKAVALHFFANHELQAFEMMAAFILKFECKTNEHLQMMVDVYHTLEDEKKHFLLYQKRMQSLGYDFGDFPCNDFFWKQMQKIESPEEYFSFMALTLEAANLDFSKDYRNVFKTIGDQQTADVLQIVYQDEIRHVSVGRHWLDLWKENDSLWEYYCINLPDMITPARSKGKVFDSEGRKLAGLSDDFIVTVKEYRDDFKVTDRKHWK